MHTFVVVEEVKMMINGAYGARLARAFRLDDSPTLVSESQRECRLAATEIRVESPRLGLTNPIGNDGAYMVGLHLRSLTHHEVWLGRRLSYSAPVNGGCSGLYDLAQEPVLFFDGPLHAIYFYIPHDSFIELDDFAALTPGKELDIRPGQMVDDAIIRNIGQSLVPYFGCASHANGLVVDYLLLALRGHLAVTYGGARTVVAIKHCGLAPWQQRTAKELMSEHLTEGISLAQISDACHLSPSAFVRAFKKSLGITPHQWLLSRRIERAVQLIDSGNIALADVALAVGFADQSHFTRIFTRKMSMSPGAYRRARCAQVA